MILCVSQEYYGESVPIPFPATAEEVREELGKLDTGAWRKTRFLASTVTPE